MKRIALKRPKLNVNLLKVVVGVGFSLLWARVMYLFWPQPSYLTFIWFYLAIGSIILKWVLFEIIDRIHVKRRLKAMRRELEESDRRVREATKGQRQDEQRWQ